MSYVIAVDIGGTFTDLVACDVETGAVAYTKSPTTYGRWATHFRLHPQGQARSRDAISVKHGTTLVINALIQRAGAKTALLTTRAFATSWRSAAATAPSRSIFASAAIRRWCRATCDLRWRSASTGGARPHSARGRQLDTLPDAERLGRGARDQFLNSYLNPAMNKRRRRSCAASFRRCTSPPAPSSREWHEFERTATAAANAYVGPQVSKYVDKFDHGLRAAASRARCC